MPRSDSESQHRKGDESDEWKIRAVLLESFHGSLDVRKWTGGWVKSSSLGLLHGTGSVMVGRSRRVDVLVRLLATGAVMVLDRRSNSREERVVANPVV